MWYILVILGAILSAINNTLRKQTITGSDIHLVLIYQHAWIVIWSLCIGFIYAKYAGSVFGPIGILLQWLGFGSISMIGYLGIMCFVHALKKESAAIVSLVANMSVFMMFAANR